MGPVVVGRDHEAPVHPGVPARLLHEEAPYVVQDSPPGAVPDPPGPMAVAHRSATVSPGTGGRPGAVKSTMRNGSPAVW